MDFLGKRTYRVRFPRQIGLDPEMALIIHRRAASKGRSITMQIVWLLTEGIRNDSEIVGNEDSYRPSQGTAHDSIQPHMGAQPRAARHTVARKQEMA